MSPQSRGLFPTVVRARCSDEGSERSNPADFEGGGSGPGAKECRGPLEVGKDKEADAPLEPLGRNAVLPTPRF